MNQVEELLSYLEEFLVSNSQVEQIYEDVKEFRFSKGKVCPHCSSELISKNGKYNGKQRYICKDCRRTFTDFTNSAVYRSKKSLDKWLKYAKCMIKMCIRDRLLFKIDVLYINKTSLFSFIFIYFSNCVEFIYLKSIRCIFE